MLPIRKLCIGIFHMCNYNSQNQQRTCHFTKTKPNQNKNQSFHAELQNKAVVRKKGYIINTCGAFYFLQKNPPKPGSGHFFEDSATFSSRLHLLPEKSHDTQVSACQQLCFLYSLLAFELLPDELHCFGSVVQPQNRVEGWPGDMSTVPDRVSKTTAKSCECTYMSKQDPPRPYCHLYLKN